MANPVVEIVCGAIVFLFVVAAAAVLVAAPTALLLLLLLEPTGFPVVVAVNFIELISNKLQLVIRQQSQFCKLKKSSQ